MLIRLVHDWLLPGAQSISVLSFGGSPAARSTRCRILPVAVRGISSSRDEATPSAAACSRRCGCLHHSMISASVGAAPSRGTITACTRSPHVASASADHRHVLHLLVRAEQRLDLGRIDVLAAGNDHVALAVDQIDVAVLVAAGHVADRAVFAAERLPGLVRQLPVAVERVGVAGVELARLAVGHVVAVGVEQPDRPRADAFAPDRAELGELLVGMQHGDPARLGRAVELEQAGIPEIVHDRELGVAPRRRRGDHQLGDGIDVVAGARRGRQVEHHDVMRRHQRGEGGAAFGQRAQRDARDRSCLRL